MWISVQALTTWKQGQSAGSPGRPKTYSDAAIECMLTFKEVYHLPLRGTQGLMQSVLNALHSGLKSPDYTTLCRRQRTIKISLPRRRHEGMHMVVDGTGVKVYGEGEWKVRQHGAGKRRTWRKLHIGVDEATGKIVAAEVSDNSTADHEVLPKLLAQVPERINQISGDGAYDKRIVHEMLAIRKIKPSIPPRRNAKIWKHANARGERQARDENLRAIRKKGRKVWKQEIGYHRRSLAETTMFRFKRICGPSTNAASYSGQRAEILTRCKILNVMTLAASQPNYRIP
jgi:hypothetical protein